MTKSISGKTTTWIKMNSSTISGVSRKKQICFTVSWPMEYSECLEAEEMLKIYLRLFMKLCLTRALYRIKCSVCVWVRMEATRRSEGMTAKVIWRK